MGLQYPRPERTKGNWSDALILGFYVVVFAAMMEFIFVLLSAFLFSNG